MTAVIGTHCCLGTARPQPSQRCIGLDTRRGIFIRWTLRPTFGPRDSSSRSPFIEPTPSLLKATHLGPGSRKMYSMACEFSKSFALPLLFVGLVSSCTAQPRTVDILETTPYFSTKSDCFASSSRASGEIKPQTGIEVVDLYPGKEQMCIEVRGGRFIIFDATTKLK